MKKPNLFSLTCVYTPKNCLRKPYCTAMLLLKKSMTVYLSKHFFFFPFLPGKNNHHLLRSVQNNKISSYFSPPYVSQKFCASAYLPHLKYELDKPSRSNILCFLAFSERLKNTEYQKNELLFE